MTTTSLPLHTVVLAAGEGTRMRSSLPKPLHQLAGRSMLGHVLAVADALGAEQNVIVLSEHTIEPVRAEFGPRYTYVVQTERLGTGHAVLQAQGVLEPLAGDVLVLYGDSPLLQPATARLLVEARRAAGAKLALLSFDAEPPNGYGRVVRDAAGHVAALVEERNATAEQRAIREANSGFMVFDGAWLWQALPRVEQNPVKNEYYLTDLVAMAVEEHGPGAALAVLAPDPRDAWGVNDRVQLAAAEGVVRERVLAELLRSGVTITDPATTYVDVGVTVGSDTTLLPGTMLRGSTVVGEACEIGPYTTVIDSTIGRGVRLPYALAERTTIEDGTQHGPFAHIT